MCVNLCLKFGILHFKYIINLFTKPVNNYKLLQNGWKLFFENWKIKILLTFRIFTTKFLKFRVVTATSILYGTNYRLLSGKIRNSFFRRRAQLSTGFASRSIIIGKPRIWIVVQSYFETLSYQQHVEQRLQQRIAGRYTTNFSIILPIVIYAGQY